MNISETTQWSHLYNYHHFFGLALILFCETKYSSNLLDETRNAHFSRLSLLLNFLKLLKVSTRSEIRSSLA